MKGASTSGRSSRSARDMLAVAFAGWGTHANSQMAAAIAYFSTLTLAPTLLIVLMIAGLFLDRTVVAETLASNLADVLGSETVELLEQAMRSLFDLKSSGSLAVVGILTLLFAATGLLLQVRFALRRIWGSTPRGGPLKSQLRERGAALVALGVLVAALVVLVGTWWMISAFFPEDAGGALQLLSTAALSFAVALTAYRYFPAAKVSWRAGLLGATLATLGWGLASKGIGLYFELVPSTSVYGAAGSLIVVLVWVYVMSTILLLGGELARAYDGPT